MMASATLIYGGSGRVSRLLTRQLANNGHKVYSIIRSSSQTSEIASLGATPLVQSIEDSTVTSMAQTMTDKNISAIIWAAGAGGKGGAERTNAVDREGAIKSMDAAGQAGVKRYIMVSAIDIRDRQGKPEPEWYNDDDRQKSDGMWKALPAYCEAKLDADRELVVGNARRGLEWTIVRPTTLGDGEGTGKVEAGKVRLGRVIPREGVAAVVVECLRNEGTKGLAFDVVGGETKIAEAVEKVAKDRVDTFEGRY